MIRIFRLILVLGSVVAALQADESVVNSKHDLSTFGPGPVRAVNETEVCIFCHAPHNTSPAAPLWNRFTPEAYYRIYRSSTTEARVDQPGLASKLCLSCHDGSIALGLTITRDQEIAMNQPFMPTGPALLTNDLSDDHPVGLRFDRQLANRDPELRLPDVVDRRVPLGPRGELECTACHDPHNNEFGDFLRIPNVEGALCVTCHDMSGWRNGAHANSPVPIPPTLTQGTPPLLGTIGQNACATCHVAHGALHRPRLLRDRPYNLCIECHNGVTARDVLAAVGLRSGHQPLRSRDRHDPAEDPRSMTPHVDCVDCHNPHATQANLVSQSPALTRLQGPNYLATMQSVPGVTIGGAPIDEARYYYEVCFRCHADNPVPIRGRIVRDRDEFGNIRRQFQPTAASAHPITFAGRLSPAETPSLLPTARAQPLMNCQDCHNNPDARQLGGGGPNGPHGSRFPGLLVDRYETADFTVESPGAYALCYRCHDRNSILNNESFPTHERHIVRGRTPCSACHSAHGVNGSPTEHSHLINFDLSIVGGERQFFDRGIQSGSCTLTCHGVRHVNFSY
ncbi:MAG: cytochrome c3 family protein [Phycisphaerae bacterium]|nr:cytochrome c3 family protein [Phycisphaerae bacterium]